MQVQEWIIERQQLLERIKELQAEYTKRVPFSTRCQFGILKVLPVKMITRTDPMIVGLSLVTSKITG